MRNAAIFEARPDVTAVVHAHAEDTLPFGIVSAPLEPVIHSGSFIGGKVPVWDIRKKFGDTNLLVTNMAQGRDLAKCMGKGSVALMRGHGNVVVGRSLPEVVFRAIYTEANARLQTDALRLGDGRVTYLSEGEAAASMATNAGVLTRAWELWRAAALGKRG